MREFRTYRRWLGVLILLSLLLQVFLWNSNTIHPSVQRNHAQFILHEFQQQRVNERMHSMDEPNKRKQQKNPPHDSIYMWNATHSYGPLSQIQIPTESFLAADDNHTLLPPWLVTYIQWHKQQRAQLVVSINNNNNRTDHEFRFLVLTCRDVCGGVSDRLKSIPLLLQLASVHNRIFLIHWERPVPLELFLLPAGRLDWRLPMDLDTAAGPLYRRVADLVAGLSPNNATVIQVTLQDQHGGSQLYNAMEDSRERRLPPREIIMSALRSPHNDSIESSQRHFRHAFRSIWSALFVPSLSLATAIRQRQFDLGLSDTYVAAHVRALYGHHPIPVHRRPAYAINALNCASVLRHNDQEPVVLFSDSTHVLNAAIEYGRMNSNDSNKDIRVAIHNSSAAVHSNDSATQQHSVQEYMDAFVDLYIMANAHCISHGRGGFGRLGVLLSRNSSCFMTHYQAGKSVVCDHWHDESV